MRPPDLGSSTPEERLAYIKDRYRCISNCENCGLCTFFKGKDAEVAYKDYIEGRRDFMEVTADFR